MKAKTKQRIAKGFAAIVVLVMIFQVFLPLFSSGVIESTKTSVTASEAPKELPAAQLSVPATPADATTTKTPAIQASPTISSVKATTSVKK